MKIDDVQEFLNENDLAVLATVNDEGRPEAAVLEFGVMKDMTLVIDTLKTSRKYANLQNHDNVAIVVGWDENITVQIEAIAEEVEFDKLARTEHRYFKKARARKWEEYDKAAYFMLKPYWVRYTDVAQSPWQIEEFDLSA